MQFIGSCFLKDNLKVKEWVTGVVLDRDCQRRVVDVSLKHGLVSVFGQASTTQESVSDYVRMLL